VLKRWPCGSETPIEHKQGEALIFLWCRPTCESFGNGLEELRFIQGQQASQKLRFISVLEESPQINLKEFADKNELEDFYTVSAQTSTCRQFKHLGPSYVIVDSNGLIVFD